MSVNTAKVAGRRTLHFKDVSQLLAEAEFVATHPTHTLGNWSVGQILDHLAISSNAAFDGFGDFKPSWFVRTLIAPFIKNSVFTKSMPAGIKLGKSTSILPRSEVTPEEGLQRLKTALARFSTEKPKFPHPVFGALAHQEWISLALRHAEMHLSFVIPEHGHA